ncbi:MAG: hypothetical protein ISR48_05140 [Alphaproteobacteria bacterium]|nr:hypothetical protein [Alphaproteobacteria bacterium]
MRKHLRRLLLRILGYALLALGVAGLFLPILQGVLFFLLGLFVLAVEEPWAGRLLERLERHHPKLGHKIAAAREKSRAWMEGNNKA